MEDRLIRQGMDVIMNRKIHHILLLSCVMKWPAGYRVSHALISSPTSKRTASEGGQYRGKPVIICSAVCTGSMHSHAVLSAKPTSTKMTCSS